MTDAWIIELPDESRQVCFAETLVVRDGHLLGFAYRYGADEAPTAAWAPNHWNRFWKRPEGERIDNLRVMIAALEHIAANPPEGVTEEMVCWRLPMLRHELADLAARIPCTMDEADTELPI